MSRRLFLHPRSTAVWHDTACYGVLKTSRRDNVRHATLEITTLCALFKPNCELAAVCRQSRTRRVLSLQRSPCMSLRVARRETPSAEAARRGAWWTLCFCWEIAVCSTRSVAGLCMFLSSSWSYCTRCREWKYGLKKTLYFASEFSCPSWEGRKGSARVSWSLMSL